MDTYRGFSVLQEDFGYRVENRGVDCGFYHTYSDAVAAIDRFYRITKVCNE